MVMAADAHRRTAGGGVVDRAASCAWLTRYRIVAMVPTPVTDLVRRYAQTGPVEALVVRSCRSTTVRRYHWTASYFLQRWPARPFATRQLAWVPGPTKSSSVETAL